MSKFGLINLKDVEVKRSETCGTLKCLRMVYFRCCVKGFEDMKMATSIFFNNLHLSRNHSTCVNYILVLSFCLARM